MPCALTQGYTLDCKDSLGGIKAVWLINHANVTAVTEASGIVSAITKAANKVFYKYELVKNTGSLTETVTLLLRTELCFMLKNFLLFLTNSKQILVMRYCFLLKLL